MPDPVVRSAAATHVGLKRARNEDSFLLSPQAALWAVADGMGGHDAGDVASRMAVAALSQVAAAPSMKAGLAALAAAVAAANRDIRAEAKAAGIDVMGATLVALAILDGQFACLWCGDSRAYLLRAGAMRQLTRDHTEVQDLVDRGVLDADEALLWPRRGVLTRALGGAETADFDHVVERLSPGDAFLLCSDGLTGHLSDDEIAATLAGADPQTACDRLIEKTLERGAGDNVTVVVVRYAD